MLILKKTFLNRLVFLIGCVLSSFFFILNVNAQDLTKDELLDLITPNDIIGETIKDETVYFNYNGGPVSNNINVVNEKAERLSSGQYKIYPGKNFEFINGDWSHFEYSTTTLIDYNLRFVDKLGFRDWLIPPAIAQIVYSESGDGRARCDGGATWDYCHDLDPADSVDTNRITGGVYDNNPTNNTFYIERGSMPFDLDIEDCDAIASATLFLTAREVSDADDDALGYVNIYSSPQTSSGAITTDVYQGFGTTPWSDDALDISVASVNGQYYFRFNNTGTSSLVTGTTTFIGYREGHDVNDTQPDGAGWTYMRAWSVEQTGTAQDPFLWVVCEGEEEEQEEETATSTSVAVPCNLQYYNELSMIVGCSEEYSTSTTTPDRTIYWYFYIPFFLWVIIAVIILFLAYILIIEFKIRMRQ